MKGPRGVNRAVESILLIVLINTIADAAIGAPASSDLCVDARRPVGGRGPRSAGTSHGVVPVARMDRMDCVDRVVPTSGRVPTALSGGPHGPHGPSPPADEP